MNGDRIYIYIYEIGLMHYILQSGIQVFSITGVCVWGGGGGGGGACNCKIYGGVIQAQSIKLK